MFRTIENGLKPAGRRMGIAFSVDDYFHVPVHSNCVRAFAHFVGSMFGKNYLMMTWSPDYYLYF